MISTTHSSSSTTSATTTKKEGLLWWQQQSKRRKSLAQALAQEGGAGSTTSLRRSLTAIDLILYGVGSSVGAGIFVLVGIGAKITGPAISASFLACGTACIFTSLAYAELASRIPVAGSAFTYVYVAFGELWAWLVGWNLILGYGFTASVTARAWADYTGHGLQQLLAAYYDPHHHHNNNNNSNDQQHDHYGSNHHHTASSSSSSTLSTIVKQITEFPLFGSDDEQAHEYDEDDYDFYTCSPLSMVIVLLSTLILVKGAKESSRFNNLMTIANLGILSLILFAAVATISSNPMNNDHFVPFAPHGVSGVFQGAGLVFFAFIGFDMVASLSEEVIEPERNMPIGIVGSLVCSTLIYVLVSLAVVGMADVRYLGDRVPILNALLVNACCSHEEQSEAVSINECLTSSSSSTSGEGSCGAEGREWKHAGLAVVAHIVSGGAMFGLMASCFTSLMGQPRIFYRMAQDGLWFPLFAQVHPETRVPQQGIVWTGIVVALLACLVPLEALANLISLGTLMVFTFVDAGVIVLRLRDLESHGGGVRLHHQDDGQQQQAESSHQTSVPRVTGLLLVFTGCVLSASIALSNSQSEYRNGVVIALLITAMIVAIVMTRLPKSWAPSSRGTVGGGATFYCPMVPWIPLAGVACNSFMMGSMPLSTWWYCILWLLLGLVVYFTYGIHHSALGKPTDASMVSETTALL